MNKIEINKKFNFLFTLIIVLVVVLLWVLFNINFKTENLDPTAGQPYLYNTSSGMVLNDLTIGNCTTGNCIVLTSSGITANGVITSGEVRTKKITGQKDATNSLDIIGAPTFTNGINMSSGTSLTIDKLYTKEMWGSTDGTLGTTFIGISNFANGLKTGGGVNIDGGGLTISKGNGLNVTGDITSGNIIANGIKTKSITGQKDATNAFDIVGQPIMANGFISNGTSSFNVSPTFSDITLSGNLTASGVMTKSITGQKSDGGVDINGYLGFKAGSSSYMLRTEGNVFVVRSAIPPQGVTDARYAFFNDGYLNFSGNVDTKGGINTNFINTNSVSTNKITGTKDSSGAFDINGSPTIYGNVNFAPNMAITADLVKTKQLASSDTSSNIISINAPGGIPVTGTPNFQNGWSAAGGCAIKGPNGFTMEGGSFVITGTGSINTPSISANTIIGTDTGNVINVTADTLKMTSTSTITGIIADDIRAKKITGTDANNSINLFANGGFGINASTTVTGNTTVRGLSSFNGGATIVNGITVTGAAKINSGLTVDNGLVSTAMGTFNNGINVPAGPASFGGQTSFGAPAIFGAPAAFNNGINVPTGPMILLGSPITKVSSQQIVTGGNPGLGGNFNKVNGIILS